MLSVEKVKKGSVKVTHNKRGLLGVVEQEEVGFMYITTTGKSVGGFGSKREAIDALKSLPPSEF